DHDGAGFRLPPCVDDRAAIVADFLAIPHPGFGVDGLADSTEQAKGVELVFVDVLIAPLNECANGCRRSVEEGELAIVDDLPEAGEVWEIGGAFVHEACGAVLHGTVDDVRVASDPADVSGAPVDVVVL